MVSEERTRDILKEICNAVVAFDNKATVELCKEALEKSIDVHTIIMKGLSAGMDKVGELYTNQEYFVPELLSCADAFYEGMEILRPHIKIEEAKIKAQIVLGVVQGDIHDIGKNLVKIMFDAAGWIVHDLGNDVKLERFVEEQQRTNSEIVGLSALMTTSMTAMPKVIRMIKEQNPDVLIMVGGAPLNREIAKEYGADGYAENAGVAVQEAIRLLKSIGKEK